MIKWLLLSSFLVNLLAFYLFSSQSALNIKNKPSWDEPSAEIVLLSELKVIPPELSLLVVGAFLTEDLDAVAETSAQIDIEAYAAQEHLGSKGNPLLQDDESMEMKPGEKGSLSAVASGVETRVGPKIEMERELPCVLLGRFDSERNAAGLLEKLEREGGVTATLRRVVEGIDRYLVYMPPFETKIEAKLQQSVLGEAGIRSSLYYKGELENGLALGFFASSNNAGRRYDSLLAAGYDVELKTMVTKMSRYWLELERNELAKLSRLFWKELAKEFPNVLSKPAECVMSREFGREESEE